MIHLAILYGIGNIFIQLIGVVDIPFIQSPMLVDGPDRRPPLSPCTLTVWGIFVSRVLIVMSPLSEPVGHAYTTWIRSSVAECHGEEASGFRPFGLHPPRQRGRHDPCAIAPDDLGGACGLCFGRPASTRARQSAGVTGCHEVEG